VVLVEPLVDMLVMDWVVVVMVAAVVEVMVAVE
jgi:hypothetical protein